MPPYFYRLPEKGDPQAAAISLDYLRDERGLKYGARSGPGHFSWFPTVVGDYFRKRHERQSIKRASCEFRLAQFDSMTDAIEI